MAKRKKRKAEATAPAKPAPAGPFHAAFAGLGQALRAAGPPPAAPSAPKPAAAPESEPEPGEAELFARAMADVRPVERGPRRASQPEAPRPRLEKAPDDDLEVLAQLADLVAGEAEFDLRFSDEYVQGALEGVGPELMDRLHQGEFPVQDYLDLHGLGLAEAQSAVDQFLVTAQTRGLRHVLIVHGRGFRSPGGIPVLKTALTQWLGQKRLAKRVLAFCTARQRDGGPGAVYVLLRKWQGRAGRRW